MDQTKSPTNSYFMSMADLLVGVIFIFLIIIFYFALNVNQSIKEIEAMREAKDLATERAERAENNLENIKTVLISIDETKIEILKKVQTSLAKANFLATIDEKSGVLRLPQGDLFKTSEYELSIRGKRNMQLLRIALEEILPCYSNTIGINAYKQQLICSDISENKLDTFLIEGHADKQPVRYHPEYKDNQELSTKRAISAFEILSQSSILNELSNSKDEFILSVSGYGDKRPICYKESATCFAENRRIDLRLIMEIPKGNFFSSN